MKPILEVKNISKKYKIQHLAGGYLSLRERLTGGFLTSKTAQEDFWAVEDISFEVMPGDSIAIIGKNGAGKSTLLKILSRITAPTKGKIITRGRIGSLLEVGTGFHPELTGRENIFFNGSLLGMKRKEIENKFDEIVDFSGVERFLDTALKHFSSGMQLRLAFSVAAFLEPEILIIDEVLAVGDTEFQKKCLGKMEDISGNGRTILFVSHNLHAVQVLCSRGILLEKGILKKAGTIENVIHEYQGSFSSGVNEGWKREKNVTSPIFYDEIKLRLLGQQPDLRICLTIKLKTNHFKEKALLAFDIVNSLGASLMQAIPEIEPFIIKNETQVLEVEVQLPPLIPGYYSITAWVGPSLNETFDMVHNALTFEVQDSPSKNRTSDHHHNHGFLVPKSFVTSHLIG